MATTFYITHRRMQMASNATHEHVGWVKLAAAPNSAATRSSAGSRRHDVHDPSPESLRRDGQPGPLPRMHQRLSPFRPGQRDGQQLGRVAELLVGDPSALIPQASLRDGRWIPLSSRTASTAEGEDAVNSDAVIGAPLPVEAGIAAARKGDLGTFREH